MSIARMRAEWFSHIRSDVLSGMVVAMALIPEAIAFSIIAGVDPKVGLYASFCIAVISAFAGGRPGMISAATGAMALVLASLVRDHGVEYLAATTVLTGILQIAAGLMRMGSLLRFVSKSVFAGFVNALAILIFMAQLPVFHGAGFATYAMVAAGLGIIYGFPYITKAVPSPLIAILVLTAFSVYTGAGVQTVGDMGELPTAFPPFIMPHVPFTLETLSIIFPYALALAAVGLLESLLTAVIVDDLTDTPSDKNRECKGQGAGNIVAGFFGGMAGCAMIGQSVINIKSGGRGRLSTCFAGAFLLFLILILQDWVRQIPMPALVAVMLMVSIGTFDWGSIKNLRRRPKSSGAVMLATTATVVITHNLAIGVLVGILMSAVFFADKVSRLLTVTSELTEDGTHRIYRVFGQVFFASAEDFIAQFDVKEAADKVTIDMSRAHFWDLSGVGALEKVAVKFRREGVEPEILGMNEASAAIVKRLGNNAELAPGK